MLDNFNFVRFFIFYVGFLSLGSARYLLLLVQPNVAGFGPLFRSAQTLRYTLRASCAVAPGLLVTAQLGSAAEVCGRRFPAAI
jgi:hypothetical protein